MTMKNRSLKYSDPNHPVLSDAAQRNDLAKQGFMKKRKPKKEPESSLLWHKCATTGYFYPVNPAASRKAAQVEMTDDNGYPVITENSLESTDRYYA